MACYHPIPAWRRSDGQVVFSERGDLVQSLQLPCGQCVGCRLERSRQWAIRCVHEASLHKENCFLTLTYRSEDLPSRGSLDYRDFQLFMKRFRKLVSPVRPRYYMCGEYGDNLDRPHFHACIFGYRFPDLVPWKKSSSGHVIYRSKQLEGLWTSGFSSVGDLNFETAAYTARYVMKKVNGDLQEDHYTRVDLDTGEVYRLCPEFTHMSLKPGIGARWIDKWESDVYPHDYVVSNGRTVRPPKYYDRRFRSRSELEFEAISHERYKRGLRAAPDNTVERLATREVVAKAGLNRLKRDSF